VCSGKEDDDCGGGAGDQGGKQWLVVGSDGSAWWSGRRAAMVRVCRGVEATDNTGREGMEAATTRCVAGGACGVHVCDRATCLVRIS
jgi:hypothetical protein